MSGFDLDAVRLRQLLTDASKKLGPEEFEALAYMFREQDRLIEESQSVYEETGLTPRQLAEQRAELLARLEALTAACEEEFCGEGTEAIEPDDSKVAFPEDECHITFGMIRSARAAIANATQQRNATGAAS